MGLAITVGILVDLRENDPEGLEFVREDLRKANEALVEAGYPAHDEPEQADWEPVDFEMHGYSGLHYLRRVAAHLAAGRGVPPPGEDATLEDGTVDAYYRAAGHGGLGGLLRRKVDVDRRFDHLLLHSDAEGFYVPVSFDEVIVSDEVLGSSLGSSVALARECDELAEALGIPDGVSPEDDELWAASENQGKGEGWLGYGIEAFTCVNLRAAARASIDRGAAIVFS